jgi:hypothetical protein
MSATQVRCEMSSTCDQPVAYLDDSGFIYCEGHGLTRRQYRACRRLRPHELHRLEGGLAVERY